jgi:membrane fusion protein (multidrug efflux system)
MHRSLFSSTPRLTLIALCALTLVGCADKKSAARKAAASAVVQPVEVLAIARRDMVESLSLVGSVAPNESAQMRAEVAGLVRAILFDEGQKVTKGQVLLKIDDTELVAQTTQAEEAFKLAESSLQRSQTLVTEQNTTQAAHDRVISEYNTSKAQFALLRNRLEKTQIKAPFDGIVGARTISPGDYVTNQTSITTIDDLSRLKLDFQVPERFLRRVHNGTSFVVRSRSMDSDKAIVGEVYFVSSVINPETRSSEVKGYLTNPPPDLKPGMFANVEVVLAVRKAVLTVPEGAIFNSVKGPQVLVVRAANNGDDATVDFVPVQLGLRSRGFVEVEAVKKDGLNEKESVVASGVGALILFQGAKVAPRPLRKEFQLDGGN